MLNDTPELVPEILGATITLLPWAQTEAPAAGVKPKEEEEEEEGGVAWVFCAAVDPPVDPPAYACFNFCAALLWFILLRISTVMFTAVSSP